jgi:gluconate kinase
MSGGKIDQIDWEKFKPFFSLISKNIGIQKARVGGNFAIAQAVQSRDQREHIKKTLPDVVFIVMSLTKENQKKRLKDRHGDQAEMMGEMLEKMFDLYEKPGDGEENAYNVDITEDMTTKDVLDKVLEVIDKNCK